MGKMITLTVETGARSEMVEITDRVQRVLDEEKAAEGVCHLFVPHTTAGITINENADPTVVRDILGHLDKLVPWAGGYRHGEGNAAAHIKACLVGSSATVPVQDGRLVLGTWQGIFLCEFDGPRKRRVMIKIS